MPEVIAIPDPKRVTSGWTASMVNTEKAADTRLVMAPKGASRGFIGTGFSIPRKIRKTCQIRATGTAYGPGGCRWVLGEGLVLYIQKLQYLVGFLRDFHFYPYLFRYNTPQIWLDWMS